MPTAEQKAHFETFGFFVLRQVFPPNELAAIREATIDVIKKCGGADALARGIEWASGGFMERHPLLTALLEDDRIYEIPETLLGPDFSLALSDALIRVGDTAWHGRNPSRESPTSTYHPTVKVGIYFESLKKETGCLRVIPGSHHHSFAKHLGPLSRQDDDPTFLAFGLKGQDIPCVALETEPGDLVVFTESVYHASFGSKTPRLLVTAQYAGKPTTDDQIARMREYHEQHTWTYHPAESFINSDHPRIRGMVAQLVELGFTPPAPPPPPGVA